MKTWKGLLPGMGRILPDKLFPGAGLTGRATGLPVKLKILLIMKLTTVLLLAT
ncbi:MAG TPA: hypothetical protein VHD83_09700 [Puia sp.]|nr:hypothetical protein [Puia sp.]